MSSYINTVSIELLFSIATEEGQLAPPLLLDEWHQWGQADFYKSIGSLHCRNGQIDSLIKGIVQINELMCINFPQLNKDKPENNCWGQK